MESLNLLSNVFKKARYGVAGLGFTGSTIITIYGSVQAAPVYTIFGLITAIPAGLVLFENRYFKKLEQQFKTHLGSLKDSVALMNEQNEELGSQIDDLYTENVKLEILQEKLHDQLLTTTTTNTELNETLTELHSQLSKIELLKTALEIQVETTQTENKNLKKAVGSVQNLYEKSREMIKVLVSTNQTLSDLDLIETEQNLDSQVDRLSDVIEKLTVKLSQKNFEDIDKDDNKLIDLEEFKNFIEDN
jgi:chromosome segregation ATPase